MNKLRAGLKAVPVLFVSLAQLIYPAVAEPSRFIWGDLLTSSLDPHQVFDPPMQVYMQNTYDGLYRYENNPPELKPWLAVKSQLEPDGKTWVVTLQSDVKFHDGNSLTSDDVVYSFKRMLTLGKGPSSIFRTVLKPEKISAVDRNTVRFELETPYAPFIATLPTVAILNSRLMIANTQENDWGAAYLASHEAGSGAYQLDVTSFRPQEVANLVRFPGHFAAWKNAKRPR